MTVTQERLVNICRYDTCVYTAQLLVPYCFNSRHCDNLNLRKVKLICCVHVCGVAELLY